MPPRVVVPPAPGVVAALGLLVSDLKNEYVRTCVQKPPDYDLDFINGVLGELEGQAKGWLDKENVPEESRVISRRGDLRYTRQGFELPVEIPAGPFDLQALADVIERFHRTHERLYTYATEDAPVEFVNLRVSAIGQLKRPDIETLSPGQGAGKAVLGTREVWLPGAGTFVECPVYDRTRLGVDDDIKGPAIIEQLDSTTLLLPGQTARVHESGSIIIEA